MRKIALLTAAMIVSSSPAAFAGGKQDFDLVNKTGYAIDEVYVSPSNASDWQEDVLGQGTLPNGNSIHIRFSRNTNVCKWDVKVVYTDGESAEWDEFDLCETSKITIHYNRKTGETSAEYE